MMMNQRLLRGMVLLAAVWLAACGGNNGGSERPDTARVPVSGATVDTGAPASSAGTVPEDPGDTSTTVNPGATGPRELIVPGVRIAKVTLGQPLDSMMRVLGRADSGDGWAGHVMAFWKSRPDASGKRYQLAIYAALDTGARFHQIREIRVTSPRFVTADGISTASTLGDILRAYPGVRAVEEYKERGGVFRIYDDRQKGIGFDVERVAADSTKGRCVEVTVHPPGTAVTAQYLAIHKYTWRVER
jgi:hypothetical protein